MDVLVFGLIVFGGFAALRIRLHRQGRSHGRAFGTWAVLATLVGAAAFVAHHAAVMQRQRLQQMVEGYAPTYAQELSEMHHAQVTLDTAPDDPVYLAMIEAEKRWLRVNPSIADIYTMRRLPDGRTVFIVDSETDYDHSGAYDEEREQRTAIGEEYESEPALEAALGGQPGFTDDLVADRWGTWVSAYVPLYDADGAIDGVLGVDYPAATWAESIARARLVVLACAGLLALVIVVSSTGFEALRAELAARRRAETQAHELAAALEQRVVERTAELTATNDALRQQMTEREQAEAKIIAMHDHLAAASHRAGMAEVASDVLHNVGNVLNSLQASTHTIGDILQRSRVPGVQRAVALLRAREADLPTYLGTDPQGRELLPYLSAAGDELGRERDGMRGELDDLRRHLEHVKQIVSVQQRHARVVGEVTAIDPVDVVADALQICALQLGRQRVEIERRFEGAARVLGEQHRLLQILVNLLRNAADAMSGVESTQRLGIAISHHGDTVRISVTDSGCGISAEGLTRLFSHGFTTKKDGHGFGLHGSARAAAEMGGRLFAESAGPGQGATFVLELPAADAACMLAG